jgi:hypothetical protein
MLVGLKMSGSGMTRSGLHDRKAAKHGRGSAAVG